MRSGARSWRRFPADLFRFTTTDLRELHIAVMATFDESAVVQPALRFDDVRAGLAAVGRDQPVADERLEGALRSLVGWGLLDVTQDHAAQYATPEDFERRNLQWSLTAHGQAAIGGVLHAVDELRRAVSLQPAVLDAIADGLGELHRLLAGDDGGSGAPARITTTLAAVEGHLESLVSSVRQFNTHLQRLLRENATDDEVFLDVKRRTVAYLEDYISGVERPSRRVALAIGRLEQEVGVAVLHDRALAGANLAPLAGDDPAPAWLDERARRWAALVAWFAPETGEAKIASLSALGVRRSFSCCGSSSAGSSPPAGERPRSGGSGWLRVGPAAGGGGVRRRAAAAGAMGRRPVRGRRRRPLCRRPVRQRPHRRRQRTVAPAAGTGHADQPRRGTSGGRGRSRPTGRAAVSRAGRRRCRRGRGAGLGRWPGVPGAAGGGRLAARPPLPGPARARRPRRPRRGARRRRAGVPGEVGDGS